MHVCKLLDKLRRLTALERHLIMLVSTPKLQGVGKMLQKRELKALC